MQIKLEPTKGTGQTCKGCGDEITQAGGLLGMVLPSVSQSGSLCPKCMDES